MDTYDMTSPGIHPDLDRAILAVYASAALRMIEQFQWQRPDWARTFTLVPYVERQDRECAAAKIRRLRSARVPQMV